jgi:DNA-directed RNA polymerase subunit omega
MDPFVVFDCAKVLPNRFALTLAAAARRRALHRGAQPRSDRPAASAGELALHEVAEGAFTPVELRLFLDGPGEAQRLLRPPVRDPELRGDASSQSAAVPVSPSEETVH